MLTKPPVKPLQAGSMPTIEIIRQTDTLELMLFQKTRLTMEVGGSRGFAVVAVEHAAEFISATDAARLWEGPRWLNEFVRSTPRVKS